MTATPTNNCTSVQHKRGTASAMAAHVPLLAEGEFGVETDTFKVKVGDGIKNWLELPYINGEGGIRVDTFKNWFDGNPILKDKELAFGFDTSYTGHTSTGEQLFKRGDGITGWNSLPAVPFVLSNTVPAYDSGRIKNMIYMTETQYTNLTPKDPTTLYIIVDA